MAVAGHIGGWIWPAAHSLETPGLVDHCGIVLINILKFYFTHSFLFVFLKIHNFNYVIIWKVSKWIEIMKVFFGSILNCISCKLLFVNTYKCNFTYWEEVVNRKLKNWRLQKESWLHLYPVHNSQQLYHQHKSRTHLEPIQRWPTLFKKWVSFLAYSII